MPNHEQSRYNLPAMPQPSRTLLFIRHAETAMAGTFCGSSDPPLNDRGHAQLPSLITRLASYDFQAVHASDLLRARETAHAIAAARSLPCQLSPALREIHFGQWESLDWETIEQRDKPCADRWIREFPETPRPRRRGDRLLPPPRACGTHPPSHGG